jgi:hypothetical protein
MIKNYMKKPNLTSQFYMSITFNPITFNSRHFSTTRYFLTSGEDKGKRKATEEDIARWEEEEASNRDIKKSREEEEDQEEKEMEKAIQESKLSKKINTNEEAGPSNYQTNIYETQADSPKKPAITSDYPFYHSESDSSVEKESQYDKGASAQNIYNTKIGKNLENKDANSVGFVPELEEYIGTQKKELKLVSNKLYDPDLSKGESKWYEGRHDAIVDEIEETEFTRDNANRLYRNEQSRIAYFNDDEGLGKTPSSIESNSSDSDDAPEDSDDSDNSDDPDDSGPSANPGASSGPGNPGSNEPGPTGEEGPTGSYRIIVPFFVLNFITEVFEQITNVLFL